MPMLPMWLRRLPALLAVSAGLLPLVPRDIAPVRNTPCTLHLTGAVAAQATCQAAMITVTSGGVVHSALTITTWSNFSGTLTAQLVSASSGSESVTIALGSASAAAQPATTTASSGTAQRVPQTATFNISQLAIKPAITRGMSLAALLRSAQPQFLPVQSSLPSGTTSWVFHCAGSGTVTGTTVVAAATGGLRETVGL